MSVHFRCRCGREGEWSKDPRLVLPCPDCHAAAGHGCRRPSGHNCEVHIPREQAVVDAGLFPICPVCGAGAPKAPEHAAQNKQGVLL